MSYAVYKKLLAPLVERLYRLEVRGVERVPLYGPLLVVANHESVLDPFVLGAALPRPIRFVGKSELWEIPPAAWLLDAGGAIPIRRGGSDVSGVGAAVAALDAGDAVAIFPGGGVIVGSPPWFRGAARMAIAAGAPVLPVRLLDTRRAIGRGTIGFPRVGVLVGEPIPVPPGKPTIASARALTRAMQRAVESLGT